MDPAANKISAFAKFKGRLRYVRWYSRKTRCGIELIRNLYLDLRFGGYCGGLIQSRFAESGAFGTTGADYWQLAKLFNPEAGIAIRPDDVLVDVGCGKGRVLNFWLHQGYRNPMIGLELDEKFAAQAARRLKPYPNVSIRTGDALRNLPEEGTIFFLFNPFDAAVMAAFKQRMLDLFARKERGIILYYNCNFIDVFRSDPRWLVRELPVKTFYRHAIITLRRDGPPQS